VERDTVPGAATGQQEAPRATNDSHLGLPEDMISPSSPGIFAGSTLAPPPSDATPIRGNLGFSFSFDPPARNAGSGPNASGPSVMFSEPAKTPSPGARPLHSIYSRPSPSQQAPPASAASAHTPGSASGFPTSQSIPLSFNDLPSRAQHLILNELIRQNSEDTAVVFTTLPSPPKGAGDGLEESVAYLSDLEVFCQGIPPVLLVQSKSMTVTMNL
jgi:solute carrier family 12 (potassium/chloride transporters), member 9